ncbi:casein kinase I-like [Oppia nitens]|uniref:casein kinase I-like n=1 Tax=Oppia nitens TaxID=1686743 RepID=UPI0023DCE86E|nr:casein kinase I-like [Oppia nitens]
MAITANANDDNWDDETVSSLPTRQQQPIPDFPPISGDIINDYVLEDCLKASHNCRVFVCHHNMFCEQKFVTKIGKRSESTKLGNELVYYKKLVDVSGVPKLIDYKIWPTVELKMIVIEKFDNIFSKTCGRYTKHKLSLEQLIPIAIQQIDILCDVHQCGIIHRGIKPDNFVLSADSSKVYIIDFNKSRRYIENNGRHRGYKRTEGRLPNGLPLFHSLNYHNGVRRSRRDDMESLLYCWIYLLRGSLPWSDIKRCDGQFKDYVRLVGNRVNQLSIDEICDDMPQNFAKYLLECRNYKFDEQPDYVKLRQLIAYSADDNNNNNNNNNNQK